MKKNYKSRNIVKGIQVQQSFTLDYIPQGILKVTSRNKKNGKLNKYFTKENDRYFINEDIKSMVNFKKHDLILGNYEGDFDLIVCRNVVIYFNNDVKNEIYRKFSNSLKKGGLLFVGATESIYNYK